MSGAHASTGDRDRDGCRQSESSGTAPGAAGGRRASAPRPRPVQSPVIEDGGDFGEERRPINLSKKSNDASRKMCSYPALMQSPRDDSAFSPSEPEVHSHTVWYIKWCVSNVFAWKIRGEVITHSALRSLLGSPLLIDISESKKIPFLSFPHTRMLLL